MEAVLLNAYDKEDFYEVSHADRLHRKDIRTL